MKNELAVCNAALLDFVHFFDESRQRGSRPKTRGTLLHERKSVELRGGNILGSRLVPGGIATGAYGLEIIFRLFIDVVQALHIRNPPLNISSV